MCQKYLSFFGLIVLLLVKKFQLFALYQIECTRDQCHQKVDFIDTRSKVVACQNSYDHLDVRKRLHSPSNLLGFHGV